MSGTSARFLDAELRPIPLRGGLIALGLVVVSTVAGLLMETATGARPGSSLGLVPAYLYGALTAQAGISAIRSPKAFFSLFAVMLVLMVMIKALV